jgi:hypothetical protein
VLVNGFFTEAFAVGRSVRQGCGLSPLLFNIAIEPLICMIKQSLLFRGIPIPGTPQEERIIAFADDATLLARDEFSIGEALRLFKIYSRASGAEINISKTTALVVNGRFQQSLLPPDVTLTTDSKICGVFFGDNATRNNVNMLKKNIENAVRGLKNISSTFFGRAQVVNFFILAKFT